MTTATAIAATALESTSRRTEPTTTTHRQTLGRAIRSEWIKLRTLRSTWIGMGALVLLLVGLGAIAAAVSTGSVTTSEEGGGFGNSDPLRTVMTGPTSRRCSWSGSWAPSPAPASTARA